MDKILIAASTHWDREWYRCLLYTSVRQLILKDYSRSQVVDMQVLKQADVVMLLELLPGRFDAETVKKNVEFYEALNTHDSSLSLCAHAEACLLYTSGTELADFRGTTPFINGKFDNDWKVFVERAADEPRGIEFGDLPIGNMFVGTIIEAGADVTEYAVGDRVCSYGPIKETEIVNAVDNYKLRKMSREASAKNAVCYDPAQFALGGIRDANVRSGDNVVVIGLGAIGQLAVQMAKKSGASIVIAVDPIEKRREIAGKYGADYCFDPTACDVGYEVKRITGKMGADAILETSGSVQALQSALKGLAYGGTIAYLAFAKPFPAGLWLGQEAHYNYGKIVFSRACSEPNPDYPRWNRKRIEDVAVSYTHLDVYKRQLWR